MTYLRGRQPVAAILDYLETGDQSLVQARVEAEGQPFTSTGGKLDRLGFLDQFPIADNFRPNHVLVREARRQSVRNILASTTRGLGLQPVDRHLGGGRHPNGQQTASLSGGHISGLAGQKRGRGRLLDRWRNGRSLQATSLGNRRWRYWRRHYRRRLGGRRLCRCRSRLLRRGWRGRTGYRSATVTTSDVVRTATPVGVTSVTAVPAVGPQERATDRTTPQADVATIAARAATVNAATWGIPTHRRPIASPPAEGVCIGRTNRECGHYNRASH